MMKFTAAVASGQLHGCEMVPALNILSTTTFIYKAYCACGFDLAAAQAKILKDVFGLM